MISLLSSLLFTSFRMSAAASGATRPNMAMNDDLLSIGLLCWDIFYLVVLRRIPLPWHPIVASDVALGGTIMLIADGNGIRQCFVWRHEAECRRRSLQGFDIAEFLHSCQTEESGGVSGCPHFLHSHRRPFLHGMHPSVTSLISFICSKQPGSV